MSFSATILFTPPPAAAPDRGDGEQQQPPPHPVTVAVGGEGLAVSGTEQLLHLIYQRLQTVSAVAQEALGIARTNQEILRDLRREVRQLGGSGGHRWGGSPSPRPTPASPEDVKGPLESGGLPPAAPLETQETRSAQCQAEGCDSYTSAVSPVRNSPSCRLQTPDSRPASEPQPELYPEGSQGSEDSGSSNLMFIEDIFHAGFTGVHPAAPVYTAPSRHGALKNSRRKRDVVLSKMVHNIHNHVSNDRRFNGSESIKSAWNIGVVKFLVEKLKGQLTLSTHHYTDKELKGACVAYFLTKRREYRNAMNPYKSLKEREEKKLRSRRYRLFGARSAIVRLFSAEDQQLWETASEELMSDEEDSPLEPGVWVARSPRFRSPELSDLCRRLDANSKHGLRPNRVPGPPSDRLPSSATELGLFPTPPLLPLLLPVCSAIPWGKGTIDTPSWRLRWKRTIERREG